MYLMNRIVEYVRNRNMKGLFAHIRDNDRFHPRMTVEIDMDLNTLYVHIPPFGSRSGAHMTCVLVRLKNYAHGVEPEPRFHPPLEFKRHEKNDLDLWSVVNIPFAQIADLEGQQLITSMGPTCLKIDRLVLAAVMTALDEITQQKLMHGGVTVVVYPEENFFNLTQGALSGDFSWPGDSIVTFSASPIGYLGYTQPNLLAAQRVKRVLNHEGFFASSDDLRDTIDGSFYQNFRDPDCPLVLLGAGLRNRGRKNEFTTKTDMRILTAMVNNIVRKHQPKRL